MRGQTNKVKMTEEMNETGQLKELLVGKGLWQMLRY